MFHNNIVKISEKLDVEFVENLPLKYLLYRFLHNSLSFFFTMGKSENICFLFFFKPVTRIKLCA